jgi:hypothetical protein
MPTVEDFDIAATVLDAAAQAAGALADPPRAAMGTGVMVGGQLTDLVAGELDAAATILAEVTAELTQLADTCRERAETGRQVLGAQQEYDTAYADYRADLRQWQDGGDALATGRTAADPGPPPDPPVPPAGAPSWWDR